MEEKKKKQAKTTSEERVGQPKRSSFPFPLKFEIELQIKKDSRPLYLLFEGFRLMGGAKTKTNSHQYKTVRFVRGNIPIKES